MTKIWLRAIFAAFALATACTRPPLPEVCDYDNVLSETSQQRLRRLGPTVDTACQELIPGHNDVRVARINLVFVNIEYDATEFLERVEDSVDCDGTHDGLLTVEPFRSNLDNINFWYIPTYGQLTEPLLTEHADEVVEPGLELAQACELPNRGIYVMTNRDFVAGASRAQFNGIHPDQMNLTSLEFYQEQFADLNAGICQATVNLRCGQSDIRSNEQEICAAIDDLRGEQDPFMDGTICALISERNFYLGLSRISRGVGPPTVVHETGHLILSIDDEYTNDTRAEVTLRENGADFTRHFDLMSHNCFRAPTREACERDAPWSDACHQGCGHMNELDGVPVWRQMEDGIMQRNTRYFGEWNELRACHVIDLITHNAHGHCETFGFASSGSVVHIPDADLNRPLVNGLAAHEEFLRTSIALP